MPPQCYFLIPAIPCTYKQRHRALPPADIKQRGVFRDTSRKINILTSRVGDQMATVDEKLNTLEVY